MKTAGKKSHNNPRSAEDQTLRDGIAAAYFKHGSLLEHLDRIEMANISYKKAEKWGYVQGSKQPPSPLGPSGSRVRDIAHIPPAIFNQDVVPAVATYPLPKTGARLESTPQLAYSLILLPTSVLLMKKLDKAEQAWSQTKADDEDEQERLRTLVTDLTKAFINDVLKSPSAVAEV
ncbi:hypothetical protein BGZ99_002525, partial [Dissophora globulifera]